jgi:hypothetical protein
MGGPCWTSSGRLIQTLVSELPIEGPVVAILPGDPGLDELRPHLKLSSHLRTGAATDLGPLSDRTQAVAPRMTASSSLMTRPSSGLS